MIGQEAATGVKVHEQLTGRSFDQDRGIPVVVQPFLSVRITLGNQSFTGTGEKHW